VKLKSIAPPVDYILYTVPNCVKIRLYNTSYTLENSGNFESSFLN